MEMVTIILLAVCVAVAAAIEITPLIINEKGDMSAQELFKSLPVHPEKLIIGYANWGECDEKLVTAVQQGVNVLIWFSINLIADPTTGLPSVSGGPDRTCVARIIHQIKDLDLPTTHLISIGGWNSPHPDTSNSVESVYASWKEWNNGLFDGFDWDIEGNDDMSSPFNHFTIECLDLMGQMSQLAKQDGFVVTMAPAESYVDITTSVFDFDLTHTYPEWMELQPNFAYHGHNTYAYLLAKYGKTTLNMARTHERAVMEVDTFDSILIQLYEGYSHAEYNTTILSQSAADYIYNFVERASAGWTVDFSSFPETGLGQVHLQLPTDRLVVGLANAWAGDGKFLLVYPDDLEIAYSRLQSNGMAPRGFGFWDIADEGKSSPQRPNEVLYLAQGLNNFLKVR